MKLSEAIRLGSLTTKQATGQMFDDNDGACALGAAVEAAGLREAWKADSHRTQSAFPFPVKKYVTPMYKAEATEIDLLNSIFDNNYPIKWSNPTSWTVQTTTFASSTMGFLSLSPLQASEAFVKRFNEVFPIATTEMLSPCHSYCKPAGAKLSMVSIISHLNDVHEWTRPRIADWVEMVELFQEAQQQAPAQAEPVPVTA